MRDWRVLIAACINYSHSICKFSGKWQAICQHGYTLRRKHKSSAAYHRCDARGEGVDIPADKQSAVERSAMPRPEDSCYVRLLSLRSLHRRPASALLLKCPTPSHITSSPPHLSISISPLSLPPEPHSLTTLSLPLPHPETPTLPRPPSSKNCLGSTRGAPASSCTYQHKGQRCIS